MKLVYKCDFCSTYDNNSTPIELHELNCVFNPINKKCYTCENYVCESWSDSCIESCKIESVDFDYMEDVQDGKIKCEFYIKKEI